MFILLKNRINRLEMTSMNSCYFVFSHYQEVSPLNLSFLKEAFDIFNLFLAFEFLINQFMKELAHI